MQGNYQPPSSGGAAFNQLQAPGPGEGREGGAQLAWVNPGVQPPRHTVKATGLGNPLVYPLPPLYTRKQVSKSAIELVL